MGDEEWTQRDGTKILVGNMSERHAKNTLRMLLKTRRFDHVRMCDEVGYDNGDFYKG